MKTAKSILSIIDAELIRINETWQRTNDDEVFNEYYAVLRVAEKAHGCRLCVLGGTVYEMRKVYSRVATLPKVKAAIDE